MKTKCATCRREIKPEELRCGDYFHREGRHECAECGLRPGSTYYEANLRRTQEQRLNHHTAVARLASKIDQLNRRAEFHGLTIRIQGGIMVLQNDGGGERFRCRDWETVEAVLDGLDAGI